MKRNVLCITAALFAAGSLIAAPKDDVAGGIKKLEDASSYSWTTTTTNLGGGGGFGGGGGRGGGRGFGGGGPVQGKASKDGYAIITSAGGQGGTTERIVKGEKSVTKNPEGVWQTPEERMAALEAGGGGGRGGRGGFGGGMFGNVTLPAKEAKDLLTKVTELKSADGALSSDLSAADVGPLLFPMGGRGGGGGGGFEPPTPTNAKGSVKFWLKDGALAKYELNVQGTMAFGENEIVINRMTTVEIKDVGTAKVEVPEDAKKKLQ